MKALLTFAFGGISLIGTLFTIFSAGSVHASFTCGSHLTTYRVTSPDGTLGGVRCVKFINEKRQDKRNSLIFVWYGEGRWGNTDYRHIGYAAKEYSGKQANFAADISGNGEGTNGTFNRLSFRRSPNWQTIQVSGGWNETWTIAANDTVQDYTSRLQRLNSCGNNLVQYVVTDSNNKTTNGTGVRCQLQRDVWYGEGNWNGIPYAHLGFFTNRGDGAADICEPSRSRTCGNFPPGSLKLEGLTCGNPEKWRVRGAWNEIWTNNHSSSACL